MSGLSAERIQEIRERAEKAIAASKPVSFAPSVYSVSGSSVSFWISRCSRCGGSMNFATKPPKSPVCGNCETLEVLDEIERLKKQGASLDLRTFVYRCIRELEYVQLAETMELCQTSEGKAIVEFGMKLLGVKDLSADYFSDAPAAQPIQQGEGK